ncbi:hypothetical protein ACFQZ4_22160 [Catellatospora coxensis]
MQDTPGTLADGSVYSPLYFLSATGSVGTALSPPATICACCCATGTSNASCAACPRTAPPSSPGSPATARCWPGSS